MSKEEEGIIMARAKTKFCPHCGAAIAAKVKKCPFCGGKIKKPLHKKWYIILISIVLFLFVGLIVSFSAIDKPAEAIDDEHYAWIESQFSIWDGHHRTLQELIFDNINDESSYKHIETKYLIITEENREDINNSLSDLGHSICVEVGDIFLSTQYSAKNEYDATIKYEALGISSYTENITYLLRISNQL